LQEIVSSGSARRRDRRFYAGTCTKHPVEEYVQAGIALAAKGPVAPTRTTSEPGAAARTSRSSVASIARAVAPPSADPLSRVVRERQSCGSCPTGFSGHSLRRLRHQRRADDVQGKSRTGHASDALLGRYIRDGDLFIDNAAGGSPVASAPVACVRDCYPTYACVWSIRDSRATRARSRLRGPCLGVDQEMGKARLQQRRSKAKWGEPRLRSAALSRRRQAPQEP
jgi:hypothetical protein